MQQGEITVWGAVSIRAFRVHWALHELGLTYRTEPIQSRTGETLTAGYLRLNPRHKIPFLQDGDVGISESAAIVQHLFRRYGDGTGVYLPRSEADIARSDEWCYFVMTELDAHTLYLIRRHGHLPQIYGQAPEAVASAEEYCREQIVAMAPRIADADPYLFGERIGVADILLATCLDWADRYGIDLPDACAAYVGRAKARPAYAAAEASNALPADRVAP